MLIVALLGLFFLAPITIPDLTGDGSVGIHDLLFVLDRFESNDTQADVTQDGIVDLLDLVLVARTYGQSSDTTLLEPLLFDDFSRYASRAELLDVQD